MRYERYELAGDRLASSAFWSRADSIALSTPEGALLREQLLTPQKVEVSTTVDSAREVRAVGDTAWVKVYLTVPNWETVGGRYDFSRKEHPDRSEDLSLAASLPRISSVVQLQLVREGSALQRRWRVYLAARTEAKLAHLWQTAMADDSSLRDRANAARSYLNIVSARTTPMDTTIRSMFTAVLTSAAYADSVSYSIGTIDTPYMPLGTTTKAFTGLVTNKSTVPLKRVELVVIMTSGEKESATAYDIPPGGSAKVLGFGTWSGEIMRHSVTEIELSKR